MLQGCIIHESTVNNNQILFLFDVQFCCVVWAGLELTLRWPMKVWGLPCSCFSLLSTGIAGLHCHTGLKFFSITYSYCYSTKFILASVNVLGLPFLFLLLSSPLSQLCKPLRSPETWFFVFFFLKRLYSVSLGIQGQTGLCSKTQNK